MNRILISIVLLCASVSVATAAPLWNDPNAPQHKIIKATWTDDSQSVAITYTSIDTTDKVFIGDLPLITDAGGANGAPLFLAFTYTGASADSMQYAVDYFFQGVPVSVGSLAGVAAASGKVTYVDLNPTAPYDQIRARLKALDGSSSQDCTAVQAWFIKPAILAGGD